MTGSGSVYNSSTVNISSAGLFEYIVFQAGDDNGDANTKYTIEEVTFTIPARSEIIGTTADDTLTGTASDEFIMGDTGNDTIDGAGGDDMLLGGEGNDTLVFDSADALIDGGNGLDTLIIKETGTLDFSNVHNIETIDLTGNGAQAITGLSLNDVLNMTDANHTITITGDVVDSVGTVDTTGWNKIAETPNTATSSHTYEYSNGADSISITIDDNVNNTGL